MRTDYQRAYSVWNSLKNRCYDPKNKDYKSYGAKGVKMCDDWLNFQNFKAWYDENYYEIDGEYMAIDKDIIGNGSKIYSPENCLIVPFRINGMFVHKENGDMRGLQPVYGRYQVKVRNPITGKNDYCGTYDTVEIASKVYKECKEAIIRGVAEEYKYKIPLKVYNALITFKL